MRSGQTRGANSVDPDQTSPELFAIPSASFGHTTVSYCKTRKFSDAQEIAVIILKFE